MVIKMNLMNKLTIHNLKLNKKRTIVTIFGIILSVALITAVATMVTSFRKSLINYEIEKNGYYNFIYYDVPKEDLKKFNNIRDIESYYYTSGIGYFKLDTKNTNKPFGYLMGINREGFEDSSIKLLSGRLPENENEVVISNHLKTNGGVSYNIGDIITIELGKRMSDGFELNQSNPYYEGTEEYFEIQTKKTFKIVGIIERPSYSIENYSAPGYTFITLINNNNIPNQVDLYAKYTKKGLDKKYEVTANILGITDPIFVDTDGFTNIYKYLDENDVSAEELDEVMNKILEEANYSYGSNYYLNKIEGNILEDSSMRALVTVAAIVIAIIIVTSVFCIKNSFDISITEKTRQYGMLRSIGATKKQIKKNVLYEAFILGLIGIPFGLLFGNLAAYILIQITTLLMSFELTFDFTFEMSILGIIISILLSIITIILSAIRSARKASKIAPIVAIRNNEDIKINKKKIKTNHLIKKIFGIGGTISDKNIKRNKKKYRTTIISIIVCVATFIALNEFMCLAFKVVDIAYVQYDYNMQIYLYNNESTDDLLTFVSNNDKVKEYSLITESYVNIKKPNYSKEYIKYFDLEEDEDLSVYINKLNKEQYDKLLKKLHLNYNDIKNKAIILNNKQAFTIEDKKKEFDVLDLKKGDKIQTIISEEYDEADNLINENIIDLEIGYISDYLPFGFKSNTETIQIIVSEEYFDNISNISNSNRNIYIISNNADKLQDEIEESNISLENYNIYNVDKEYKSMKSLFILIAIFLYGFIIVIALIGITNIYNTITTNVNLRSREFAMLKSIGMTKKEFNRMVSLESLFLGFKSLIWGIPIGLGLGYIIFIALTDSDFEFSFIIPYSGIIISIVVVFLLIFSLMKYSVNKINKQNIIETIRNENI